MKRTLLIPLALPLLAGIPLVAQRATRTHHLSPMPVIADFDGPVSRSYLGVGVTDLTNERVQALKLKNDRGVEVTQVDQDAPAGKAGFKEHDVIVGFNGTPVESTEQFKRLMCETSAGRTVSLDIVRDGQPQNIKVQVADRKKLESSVWPHEPGDFAFAMPAIPPVPAMPDFPRSWNEQTITRVRSASGVTLENLTPQLGDYFGVKNGEGLLVRSVQKGSFAETAGLRAGDVIVKVGDQKVSDNADWREALRNAKNGKISVVVVRDKKEQTLSMSVPMRKGPDSSALYQEPDSDSSTEAASETFESVDPSVEIFEPLAGDGVRSGMSAVDDVLIDASDMNRTKRKAWEQLHRDLIHNRDLTRGVSGTVKVAFAEMNAHRAEIQKAMIEAQRGLHKLHLQCESEMQ